MNALQVTKEDEEIMDQFLDKIKNEYKDAWTEENWEQVRKYDFLAPLKPHLNLYFVNRKWKIILSS